MRKQKQMQHKGFQCFFSVQQIEDGKKITKENIMLIRHAADGKLYLHDMVNIKKETSTPLEQ